eukprot:COSAG02_NODE_14172_length_1301_cov_0.879368_2_plen_86_part_00
MLTGTFRNAISMFNISGAPSLLDQDAMDVVRHCLYNIELDLHSDSGRALARGFTSGSEGATADIAGWLATVGTARLLLDRSKIHL